jgi:hypothetical protein
VIRAVWSATGVKASRVPIWKAGIPSSVVPDRCSTSRPSSRIARCGARRGGTRRGHRPILLFFSILSNDTANASSDHHSNHSNGGHFPMATRHYLYHLSHMTGLGVRTVSDDESPLHRAIVKLTLTTRQSGPLASPPWFPGAGVLAHVPRGRRRPDLGRGLHLQSDSKPWPWNIATKRCIWSSIRGWRRRASDFWIVSMD